MSGEGEEKSRMEEYGLELLRTGNQRAKKSKYIWVYAWAKALRHRIADLVLTISYTLS